MDSILTALSKRLINVTCEEENKIYYGTYELLTGKTAELKFEVPANFPYELPKIFVKNKVELNLFIPHVEKNGLICYITDINRAYNIQNTEDLIIGCIDKGLSVLDNGLSGQNKDDFRTEFIAFWDQQENMMPIFYLPIKSSFIKEVDVLQKDNHFAVVDKNDKSIEIAKRFISTSLSKNGNCEGLYIPIRKKNEIYPQNPEKIWKIKDVLNLIYKNVSSSNKRELKKRFNRRQRKNLFLFLDIPISSDNNVVIGFFLKNDGDLVRNNKREIMPVLAKRLDQAYLIERTSGEHSFSNLKVAVIGVGSVGSKIATKLADLSINKLTTIDNDILEKDNIARHALGADSLSLSSKRLQYKTDVLEEYLLKNYPHTEFDSESMSILDLLNKDPLYFQEYDFIFVAIGDTMTSLKLNDIFYKQTIPHCFVWMEPLGVGGHCLYSDGKSVGCFECLYRDCETGSIISNRASLIEEGQLISKQLGSCRSQFVPYNSLASDESALEAVKLFHRIFSTQSVPNNAILSWTGNDWEFERLGFKHSARFSTIKGKVHLTENFASPKCPICRKSMS